MKDLGSFGGAATASVNGLNERGEVVGGTDLPGDTLLHPFLWDGAKLIDLIAPPFVGEANGEAAWINNAGEVVGLAGLAVPCADSGSHVEHAFLWRNGVMTDLGTIAGTPNSQASFINSKTQIVGLSFACDFSVFNAILWENGSMVDLNTLISPNSPFHLYSASFIDDRGQMPRMDFSTISTLTLFSWSPAMRVTATVSARIRAQPTREARRDRMSFSPKMFASCFGGKRASADSLELDRSLP